jgi:1,3-beta-glucan synthase
MKQSKLRRRRVVRYAILYFTMLVVFLALIVGPIVAGKQIPKGTLDIAALNNKDYPLLQPTGQNNDDTRGHTETGTKAPGYTGVGTSTMSQFISKATDSSSSVTSAPAKLRLF